MDLFVVLVLAFANTKIFVFWKRISENFFFKKKDDNLKKKCYNKKKWGYGGMVDATDLGFMKSFLSFFKEI